MSHQKNILLNKFHNQIVDLVVHGDKLPFTMPWRANEARLAHNVTSKKRYQGINQFLLSCSGYRDPRWGTINQINKLKGKIKKGEPATLITYFQLTTVENENGDVVLDDNGDEKKIAFRRYYYVFNMEQCEGIEPYDYSEDKEQLWEIEQTAEEILNHSNATILHNQADKAFYQKDKDIICLPEKWQFDTSIDYYSVALHELGHWTGHSTRLDRDLTGKKRSIKYAKEELRAELASYFMAMRIGLSFDPSRHVSYLQSWVSIIKDQPEELVKACKDAEKICDFLQDLVKEQQLLAS